MSSQNPDRWARRNTERHKPADQRKNPNKDSNDSWAWATNLLEKVFVTGLTKTLVFALAILSGLALHKFGFNEIKDFLYADNNITDKRYFTLSGQLLTLDESHVLPGVSVVVVGYDVESGETDQEGYFDMRVELPVNTEIVELRFIDENNHEILKESKATMINSIKGGQIERHYVANNPI